MVGCPCCALASVLALSVAAASLSASPSEPRVIVTPEVLLSYVESNSPDIAATRDIKWAGDDHVVFSLLAGNQATSITPDGELSSIDIRSGLVASLAPLSRAVSTSDSGIVAFQTSDKEVRLVTADGHSICSFSVDRLMPGSGAIRSFALRSDGQRLAIAIDVGYPTEPPVNGQLVIVEGAVVRVFSNKETLSSHSSQQRIGTSIVIVDRLCRDVDVLAKLPDQKVGVLAWNPRANMLVALAESPTLHLDYPRVDSLVVNVGSRSWRTLFRNIGGALGYQSPLHFSPDGAHFAFPYDSEGLPYSLRKQFAIASLGDAKVVHVSADPRRPEGWLSSNTLLTTRLAPHASLTRLQTTTIDGVEQPIVDIPGGAVVSPNRKHLAWMEVDLYGASRLVVADLTQARSAWTARNQRAVWEHKSPLSGYVRAERRVVTCQSTDGVVPAAVLTLPLNFQTDRHYPVIVDLHGGPRSGLQSAISAYTQPAILNHTTLEHDMWAAKGYAVLAPDYRASGYYGFDKIARDGTGFQQDFQDIMCHVNQLVAQGIADASRMVAIGHSYGSAEVNWIVTHSSMFAAAMSSEGSMLADFRIAWGAWGRPNLQRNLLYGLPFEFPDRYRRMSVVDSVRGVTTPTLFVQHRDGKYPADLTGWLFAAWQAQGIEAELRQYEYDGHVLTRDPDRRDMLFATLRWVERFTTSPRGDRQSIQMTDVTMPHLQSPQERACASSSTTPPGSAAGLTIC